MQTSITFTGTPEEIADLLASISNDGTGTPSSVKNVAEGNSSTDTKITAASLANMSFAQLKALAVKNGVPTAGKKSAGLRKAILEKIAGSGDDDEEEEEQEENDDSDDDDWEDDDEDEDEEEDEDNEEDDDEEEDEEEDEEPEPPKRGRGRPKGSTAKKAPARRAPARRR